MVKYVPNIAKNILIQNIVYLKFKFNLIPYSFFFFAKSGTLNLSFRILYSVLVSGFINQLPPISSGCTNSFSSRIILCVSEGPKINMQTNPELQKFDKSKECGKEKCGLRNKGLEGQWDVGVRNVQYCRLGLSGWRRLRWVKAVGLEVTGGKGSKGEKQCSMVFGSYKPAVTSTQEFLK